ncbi:hypothetical protein BHAOGJBA_4450 [Methylobacterium hispanicum]|uniref:Uncharacterized protein n=1 Tax=Methylobacterium hispanicum TaxID=270350 RepID=A0AAV4ZQQ0_9HYPH|nr:hypothetical protein [Methylobacterium hispanicum]GJD90906.1 hypothetical protein BHAOGJBA_4450 [Methylobacterium hispanicum]
MELKEIVAVGLAAICVMLFLHFRTAEADRRRTRRHESVSEANAREIAFARDLLLEHGYALESKELGSDGTVEHAYAKELDDAQTCRRLSCHFTEGGTDDVVFTIFAHDFLARVELRYAGGRIDADDLARMEAFSHPRATRVNGNHRLPSARVADWQERHGSSHADAAAQKRPKAIY